MVISKSEFSFYIKDFRFKEMFNYFGWDNDRTSISVEVDGDIYELQSIAQKSGFKIFTCCGGVNGQIPLYSSRRKIDHTLTAYSHDHIIIYINAIKTEQIWQFVYKSASQPQKVSEIRYNVSQDVERLYQRTSGLVFELDEEDNITIVDVTQRVRTNIGTNSEKITKKFYDSFKKHHKVFLNFIKGIDDQLKKEWYASLMLNRLMFCYFIQKKGFLDGNKNYLRDKLNECKSKNGKGKFYSFYRSFLLKIFHQGLGSYNHTTELYTEIGNIPYLNGSLFDVHEIEQQYENIDIADDAFEKIFDFFDEYDWHLDNRVTATGKEINPDVLGYIFEKYINDRTQMGAYYTQEDITEYISINCIIPYLLMETEKKYNDAFESKGFIWTLLRNSGDKYIFDSVKKGVELKLPSEIENGIDTIRPNIIERRNDWNKLAYNEYALPTETWREVIERRQHYSNILSKVVNGQINTINDFITYNLNIRLFLQDIIENIDDDSFIRVFYKVLSSVTILDPTCGSGAFLFSAMNVLAPLYEATIMRMENYVEEGKHIGKRYKFFEDELYKLYNGNHPNKHYFIYKNIILNNLYGVDIMKEAVETAKLRLFLKLVSLVEPNPNKENMGLEPLPDIDFNIKSGNALVGIANEYELENAMYGNLEAYYMRAEVKDRCYDLTKAMMRYKEIQLGDGENFEEFKESKKELYKRQKLLNEILDKRVYKDFLEFDFDNWKRVYQPFHWYAEYYEIIAFKGGFDIIIGNPPYLEMKQVQYTVNGYKSYETKAVHALCIERASNLLCAKGCISMIVPLSIVSTQRMKIVQDIIQKNREVYYSNYSWRPGKLFDTVNRALTIFIAISGRERVHTTGYIKWNSFDRNSLFYKIKYNEETRVIDFYWKPKISQNIENDILQKILSKKSLLGLFISKFGEKVYYRTTGGLYWKVFTNFPPDFIINGIKSHSSREKSFSLFKKNHVLSSIAVLSSSTFWWWYTVTSNLRDLNPSDINNFPINEEILDSNELQKLGKEYVDDLQKNSRMLKRLQNQTGETITQSFKVQLSKPIIDKIDTILAQYYGFTEEELDFIINYDIKYRMGCAEDEED